LKLRAARLFSIAVDKKQKQLNRELKNEKNNEELGEEFPLDLKEFLGESS